jgi:signal transduction histidine kinase
VRDNGIGIEAGLLPQVFDLFTQAERTPDRAQGGLGIGLALVRNIVSLHGGAVTAHSEGPGKGSVFTVSLDVDADA